MNIGIGEKVQQLRQDKNLSLKYVSDRTGLSATYLSKFERGLMPINVDNLERVCSALGVGINYFIGTPKKSGTAVVHKYERQVDLRDESSVYYNLSNIEDRSSFLARYVDLLPRLDQYESTQAFPHEGEEFIYILRGKMELWLNNTKYVLFAGDAAHYRSAIPHKWANTTNENVQLLTINDINFYTDYDPTLAALEEK